MPRQVRIEYPGAIYHGMARGNRREAIVLDDKDRDRFRKLLSDLVQQTGWEVFAWVLMTNHYHLVFRTPEPNLVEGMKWRQNTWTKRFNARHGMWGHVYGGRCPVTTSAASNRPCAAVGCSVARHFGRA